MTDYLAAAARHQPDALALDDGERAWTYAELERRVQAAAARLRAAAVAGRPVALVSETTGDAVVAAHAALVAGAVLVPLNPRLTAEELRPALDVLRPRLVLAAPEAWDRVLEAGARPAPLSALEGDGGDVLVRRVAPSGWPELPAGTRVVLWTSGTGGRPRGIALTHENLDASIAAAVGRLGLGPGDRWLATLGIAHVGGLLLVLRAAATGALLIARGRFRADEVSALMDGASVTHASLVPTMLRQLLELRADQTSAALRCLLIGGAHCPRTLVERALAAGFPLALTYGMTEATSQAATAPPALVRSKPGTVGTPLEGVELKIDDAGEVLLRGTTVAAGYLGSAVPLLDGAGWLHTGDLGEIDPDGHLWVTGRRSDRIVTGGVNVDPAEVEEILRLHTGVSDAVVVGLPDERWGEVVAAAVVRLGGAYPDPSELEGLARARLTTAKVPRRWIFIPELPRNANGKVDRDAVRHGFASA
ncbi:MAG: 2-succinylbenzoate-CoA ligase [Myxococcales bacterium]|nr:2-succinylbenzoate-CoA ligase [Myxococcales bacterium]